MNKYLENYLDCLKKLETDEEKLKILDKIYSDGFEDGANEEKEDLLTETERDLKRASQFSEGGICRTI
jgi:hypothetical protein